MIHYLLIANKSDSDDYCRGCHMASYPGDFAVFSQLPADALIDKWAEYKAKNKRMRINEDGYEFLVFQNGIRVYEQGYHCWDGENRWEYNSSEYWENYELNEEEGKIAKAAIAEIDAASTKKADELVAAIEKVEKLAKEAEAKKQFERELNHKRQELARLKQELGEQ